MKRLLSVFSFLVVFTLIVSACGGGAAPEPTEAPAVEEPTEAPAEEPTEAPAEEEPTEVPAEEEPTEAPAEEPTGGFEGTIKIASQSPLSGPQAALGTGIRNGAELGIEQLAAPLTDLGFTVELAPFDDEAQPEKGVANANSIAADTEIFCVNGHLNSGVALAALPTYESAELAMVSPANTNPLITEDFPNAFRIVGRDDVQGAVGEQFARETLGVESVYILHDQTDYGQGVAEFFRQNAEANGLTVLGFEGTQERAVFDSILTPIAAAQPDLIYFGGIYDQAGPMFRQARDRGITAQFMGPDGMDSPELAELAGDAVDGMFYTSVAAPVSQFPDAAQFAEDYEAAYGEAAPPFSAQAYDVSGICVQAIAAAAEAAGGLPTRAQVQEALRTLPEYQGITGSYVFNENGDPEVATYYVLQANVADWNANELADRLEISPPGSDAAMEAEGEMAGGTIVDVASEAGSFTTLLAAAEAAGLVEALSGDGPLTVFAPTDEAFAALPEGLVDALIADPDTLSQILLYHVVDGAVLAEDVVTLESATTLEGSDIAIAVDGDTVTLNEGVTVVATDVQADNGVIHVIDGVLLPPDITLPEVGGETGAAPAVEPFGEGRVIKIASQSPLSGPQAALGTGIRNGAELGIEQLAAPLTDLGFTVELAPFDDEAQPEKGVANANSIAADTEILCVNGHLNSGVALAALPTYESAELAMVSPANTNPLITEDFPNAFRIVGRDDVQGAVGEQFARENLSVESVYILHDQTDYGQGVAEFFRQNAEANGLTVLGFEGTQERAVFDSILTPIAAAQPDLIYFGGIYDQAGPMFRQARDRGITAQFMGPDGMDSPELAELAGDAVDGMFYTSVAAPVSQFPDAAQFAEDYEAAYGEVAPPFSAQAYDVSGICVQAIAAAAIEAGDLPTRAQVQEALRTLSEYQGITGSYVFNENGDPAEATYYVLQANVADWNANELADRLQIAPPQN